MILICTCSISVNVQRMAFAASLVLPFISLCEGNTNKNIDFLLGNFL